jgi:DNA-binding IclR family transcriptional regulator
MATLADADIDLIVQRRADEYAAAGITAHGLWKAVYKTRRIGFSETRDITTVGVTGFGFAFRVTASFIASISIGAVTQQLTESKKRKLVADAQERIGEVVELVSSRMCDAPDNAVR